MLPELVYRYVLGLGLETDNVPDNLYDPKNGYRYVLGLGLELDNVPDNL